MKMNFFPVVRENIDIKPQALSVRIVLETHSSLHHPWSGPAL
jgi:hypothetical protein